MIVYFCTVSRRAKARILIISLAAIILACTSIALPFATPQPQFPDDPRVDRSFLTEKPCEAPCWYGLELGRSGIEDVRATLKILPFVDQTTLFENADGPNGTYFGFDCVYYHTSLGGTCGALRTSSGGELARIDLSVQYPLALASVIDRLGEPEYYNFALISGENVCRIIVFWPSKSISAVIHSPSQQACYQAKEGQINVKQQVEYLLYSTIERQELESLGASHWPRAVQ